jgi:hypothetical protein
MTDTTSIPLSRLSAWDGNVRKTGGADTSLAELSASIAAHGVLQSLLIRPLKRGRYEVIAGGRRLKALQHLAEQGRIDAEYAVPCQILSGDADATEASLNGENYSCSCRAQHEHDHAEFRIMWRSVIPTQCPLVLTGMPQLLYSA